MMKHILIAVMLCWNFTICYGQNFLFNPPSIQRELPVDAFSIDQINISPLYPNDTAYISYRLIENTCPSEWEFILCDWSDCFTGMPNTDDMHPLPNGYNALIKISAHPHQTEGNGYLHFWIFPTGNMDQHESIFFHYNTPNASQINTLQKAPLQYQYNNEILQVKNAPIGNWKIFDFTGKMIHAGFNNTTHFSIEKVAPASTPLILIWEGNGEMLKISPSR